MARVILYTTVYLKFNINIQGGLRKDSIVIRPPPGCLPGYPGEAD